MPGILDTASDNIANPALIADTKTQLLDGIERTARILATTPEYDLGRQTPSAVESILAHVEALRILETRSPN